MSAFPPPPPGAERRRHVRKDVLVQVELQRADHPVVIASINNLSMGGAFLLHPYEEVAANEVVRVHLIAGGLEAVQDARVVRVTTSTPRGFAVSWVDPGPQTIAVLERMLRTVQLVRPVSALRDAEKPRGSSGLRPR